jgi:hypothetical protein
MIYLFIICVCLCVIIIAQEHLHSQERERLTNLLTDAKDSQIRQAGGTVLPSSNQQPRLKVEPPRGWFDRK